MPSKAKRETPHPKLLNHYAPTPKKSPTLGLATGIQGSAEMGDKNISAWSLGAFLLLGVQEGGQLKMVGSGFGKPLT